MVRQVSWKYYAASVIYVRSVAVYVAVVVGCSR